jgi:hypothetical protein
MNLIVVAVGRHAGTRDGVRGDEGVMGAKSV